MSMTTVITTTCRETLIRRLANFLKLPSSRNNNNNSIERKRSVHPELYIVPATPEDIVKDLARITTIYDDCLYLSGAPPITSENLHKLGVTLVICALTTYEEQLLGFKYPDDVRVTYIRAGDLETVHLHLWFETAAKVINEELTKGGKCLVHCAAGVSRSVSLILAYLIKCKSLSLSDAFRFVHEKRKIVRPNRGFIQQLIEFEKKCRGKQSSSIIDVLPCTKRKYSL